MGPMRRGTNETWDKLYLGPMIRGTIDALPFYMYILIFILTNNCVCFRILTLYSEW